MKTIARYISSAKGIARKGMSTFAAVVLFVLLAPWTSVFASAPVTWYYITGYSWFPTTPYSTADALCSAFVTARNAADPSTVSVCASRTQGPAYIYTDRTNVSNGAVSYNIQYNITPVSRCSDGSAPDTSKPLEQQCGTPAPQCPDAGTHAGTFNITTGWANGPTPDSPLQVTVVPSSSTVIHQSYGGCDIVNSGPPIKCYQSSQPSLTGLYRVSCDFQTQYTAAPAAEGSTDINAPTPAPPCPGTSGTINGQPACLDSPSSTPNDTTPTPTSGNPVPGNPNAPDSSPPSSSFDPTTGAGSTSEPGSPGSAGGGSGGGGGGSGDGTTVPVAGGSGSSGDGENTGPKECGTPGKPKCQIDESGTPKGTDTKITDEQVNSYVADRTEQMEKKQEGWDFGWTLDLPQGACQPWTVGARGLSMTFDWCPYLEQMRALLGWFYMMITAVAIYGSFRSSAIFNKG